jgi:hypothetical protein
MNEDSEQLRYLKKLGPSYADNKEFIDYFGVGETCEVDALLTKNGYIDIAGCDQTTKPANATTGDVICFRPVFVNVSVFPAETPPNWDGHYNLCYQHSVEVMASMTRKGRETP